MPVNTSDTDAYSTAHTTSVMMIPNGKSRFGFLHSSAAHETESNPIYVKNTIAAPVSTPENPFGKNGCQFAVFTAFAAPKTKIRIARIFTATMPLFAPALSRTPRTRIHVNTSNTTRAGTLNQLPVSRPSMKIGFENLVGRCHPKMFSKISSKYAPNPTATAMFDTAYSRIRSHPMIHAKISPRVAYA